MVYNFSYSGTIEVRPEVESKAVAIVAEYMGKGNDDGTFAGAIRESFPDADVRLGESTDGVNTYGFSGSGTLYNDLEETLTHLASVTRFRIECRGEDSLWLYVGTEGLLHDIPGEIVYPDEADLPMDAPVPG